MEGSQSSAVPAFFLKTNFCCLFILLFYTPFFTEKICIQLFSHLLKVHKSPLLFFKSLKEPTEAFFD